DLNNTPETSAKLLEVAREAVVLLKNEGNILPLSKKETVAVIGPSGKIGRINGGGSASLNAYYNVSIFEGVSKKLEKEPPFALGCSIDEDLYDFGKFVTHENGTKKGASYKIYKEPADAANRTLVEEFSLDSTRCVLFDYTNPAFPDSVFYMDVEGEFTPEVSGEYDIHVSCLGTTLFYLDDELAIDDKTNQTLAPPRMGSSSVGDTKTFYFDASKSYKFKILFGSGPTFTRPTDDVFSHGGGSLKVTIDKKDTDENRIKEAVELASTVDKVILCTGTSADYESEGFDRKHMDLPGAQDELIEAVLAVNPNVIIVNQSGTPVTMPWADKVKGIVQGWFNGSESGNAIADVLYNDYNPSGKLSLTFPKRVEDNPAFLTFKSNNGECIYGEDVFVGYRFYEKTKTEPLFAFGYDVVVSVDVTNTGSFAGQEVVQFYVAPPKTTTIVERPLKELKGFKKVAIEAGATVKVTIEVPIKYSCSYYDSERQRWAIEAGEYTAIVGNSSDSADLLTAPISIAKTSYWTVKVY
ncbi:hypothetical protein CANARDRAFT_10058, partial [[Candida] arabinofermentans NRRL YB-2248]